MDITGRRFNNHPSSLTAQDLSPAAPAAATANTAKGLQSAETNNSHLKNNNNKNISAYATRDGPRKDSTTPLSFSVQTKCLIAIIVSLLLVIFALVLFNRTAHRNEQHLIKSASSPQLQYGSSSSSINQQQYSSPPNYDKVQQNHPPAVGGTAGPLMSASSDRNHDFAADFDHNEASGDDDNSNNDDNTPSDEEASRGRFGKSDDDNSEDDGDKPTGRQLLQIGVRKPTSQRRPPHGNSIISGNINNNKLMRDPDAICMTPGCIRASAQILNNMDNKTEPCEDFYQFACGRWVQTQVIPDEKTSLSIFSQNTADLNVKLRALIERRPNRNDPPIVGQMRNMFASCMNLTDIEARGDGPLLDMLRDLGGWPVLTHPTTPTPTPTTSAASLLTGAIESNDQEGARGQRRRRRRLRQAAALGETTYGTSWLDIIGKFRDRGFSHDMIIDLSVVADARNSERYIVELDQSSLGLPDRSYYPKGLNDTTVSAYYKMMTQSAIMLGAPQEEAERQMLEAFEFEASLASISLPRDQRRNVTRLYNKISAFELHKLAPNINWPRYFELLLRDDQFDLEKDEILVKVPSFIRELDGLLQRTEPRIVANYLIWRIVRSSMSSLSRRWRELSHAYSSVTTGRQVEEPRWEQCLNSLEGTLNAALSALYVKNHFNEQSKAAALEMVVYIREEFLRILDEIDWMDEETREEAREKARAIAHFIGYPDELLQDELIEDYYKGIEITRENFYMNTRRLRIWSTNYAFSQLRKANKRGEWKKHARAAVVNAFYNPIENSIEFPAGILQGAFFDAERPKYLNFGAIGYVIGHEITHGFDDRGRQFDKSGNNRNWWKPKTDARFRERAQCIIDQYGNYTVSETGTKVNGFTTQGENIADNGGIKQAFRSYRRWTKDHGREARLPGLNFTPDQLFWISAANIWCGKFRPEVLKLRLNSGVHSPARFRVIGPLSNSQEFAQSFNCPVGSPMNPAKKCSVW